MSRFQPSPLRRISLQTWLPTLSVLVALVAWPVAPHVFARADLGTLEPGKVHVAFTGDMPMASFQNGQFVGTDGEMFNRIAHGLDLEIVPEQMDWAAAVESVSVGRSDLLLGAVGWSEERSEVMLLSDPLYYFGVFLAQKRANTWHTLDDLAGKRVGTVTGFLLVPELKAVPGIGEARLYDTPDAVMRDLVAGRIDIAILDPPMVALAIIQHPEWDLHQVPLTPDPNYPLLSTKYQATMGIRTNAQALHDAINTEIDTLWAECANETIMAGYGLTDASFFSPPDPNPRVGIDRDEAWTSPTLNAACVMTGDEAAAS